MLGNLARMFVLAAAISGLCAPVQANTTAVVSGAVSAANSLLGIQTQRSALDQLQLAQSDLALPHPDDDMSDGPIVEAVEMPVVAVRTPPVRIALLLPRRSESLAQVSDAVRAGFMAAYQYEPANIVVNLVETGDAVQDVLSGYLEASMRNDIVVGPLTRSGATAIAQNGNVNKPTIALTQLNAADEVEMRVPANMLVMGLSIEDEARQVANWAGKGKAKSKAFAISTNASWQRRAVKAFAAEWSHLGMTPEAMELSMTGSFINAAALVQLKKRIQTEKPALIFVALDAAQTIQLRLAIGSEVPMIGTSQLNPLALADWANSEPLRDLEGVRLLDMPWQLQTDHAAVMAYPHLAKNSEQRISPDIERLYALGIDAYRVAHNIAIKKNEFNLDGVTGKLAIRFGQGASHFERVMQPAIYRDGMVQALETP
ncbi:penicillin-binding protein activator [Herminiimonas fonticola]|uniref:penicillin-binding protein activator n=1 Tax=Herminiimonas fonticola TaxID=303380 RepID=UPI0033419DB0